MRCRFFAPALLITTLAAADAPVTPMWSSTTDVVPKGDFIELAPEQAELFAREIVESAQLFSSGDVARYREFVEERRVEAGVFASQENAEAHWNGLQRSYSGLVLDGSNIVVRPWKIGAQLFPVEADRRSGALRSEGHAPTLDSPAACPTEQYEAVFVARLNDAETSLPFTTHAGFILQHDCTQDRWTIVGLTVYERPKGARIVFPPF